MEKERQLDGRMLDDLHKLVEYREQQQQQQHHFQTTRNSDSEPNTPDSLDAPSIV
jgi:hypothetical protein